jgi:arginase family enzyme
VRASRHSCRFRSLRDVSQADTVISVPFDSGVSYQPGARFGRSHIREASRLLRPCNPAKDVELFSSQQIADAGELSANPFNLLGAVDLIEQGATELSSGGTRLVTLGGDHTIAVRCCASWRRTTDPSRCCASTLTSTLGTAIFGALRRRASRTSPRVHRLAPGFALRTGRPAG